MDSSLYCSCILHEKLIRWKHQLFLERLLACQTYCFELSAQTSRLLNHIPSLCLTHWVLSSLRHCRNFQQGVMSTLTLENSSVFSTAAGTADGGLDCDLWAWCSLQPQTHSVSNSPGMSWISHGTPHGPFAAPGHRGIVHHLADPAETKPVAVFQPRRLEIKQKMQ